MMTNTQGYVTYDLLSYRKCLYNVWKVKARSGNSHIHQSSYFVFQSKILQTETILFVLQFIPLQNISRLNMHMLTNLQFEIKASKKMKTFQTN